MRILILCTGNSCRSQMAHGILQALDDSIEVHSAGTHPAERVHPKAIEMMHSLGLDISKHTPHSVDVYLQDTWDYVITVCGGAQEICPMFAGQVRHRLHIGFEDPAEAVGTDAEVDAVFQKVRDAILRDFFAFYHKQIRKFG